ncbi:MAG: type II secretion system F family protein [Bacteroidota bacterium]
MESMFFVIFAITISVLIYFITDEEEISLLHQRLSKISNQKQNDDEEVDSITQFKDLFFNRAKPLLNSLAGEAQQRLTIKNMLIAAGHPASDEELMKFSAQRLLNSFYGLIVAVILIFAMGLNFSTLLMGLSIPVLTYILPIFTLRAEGKKRSEEISYSLPDALDLLTVCIEAGLGIDAAMARVAKEFSRTSIVLSAELDRVSKEILAGVSRQDAFRNLGARNNVPELKSFVALLIQTDKLGASIAQSLRVHCDTVRTRRRQRVEELAQQASVKMTIPLVLFILPSMFVVILAPAMLSLMKNIK